MSYLSEEYQDNSDQCRGKKILHKKRHAVASVTIAAAALLTIPVLAWFYFQKSLQTVTKINAPNPLVIGAGNARDITELELSNIDVSEGKYRDVVFCVYSSEQNTSYHLQLAHTTNIGFTYTIFQASRKNADAPDSVDYLDKTYYFDDESPLNGGYLNEDTENPGKALKSGGYHNTTYPGTKTNAYSNVQINAEPLYWKTSSPVILAEKDDTEEFINYFVLRVAWGNTVQNNKETDMIYLMAEATTGTTT